MDWIDFDRWADCRTLERPGIVFEVENGTGQSLVSACVLPFVVPADWTSGPVRFRPLEALPPRHSSPIPPASDG